MDFEFATKPYDHQLRHFRDHRDDEAWGLLWEQGTGKTKPVIDTAAYLYKTGKIDAMLVVAPPGVERNWNTDEIPEHLPPDVANDTRVEVFSTKRKNTKAHQSRMKTIMTHHGFAVLLINYSAFMTKVGKNTVWKFLRDRRVLYVLDESHNIKTPKAKRTQSIVASGAYALYRRILTGTPMAVGPFDLYSQVRFLQPNFWKERGIDGSVPFRRHFGEWFTAEDCKKLHGYDPGFDKLIRYKNLDELAGYLNDVSDRVLKDDVLDLPPKSYSKRYVVMTPEQEAVYEQLKEEFYYEFSDGQIVDAELSIVRLLRFQQVLCGYLPVEDEEPHRLIGPKNPRLEAMEGIRDETGHKAIVWARFRHDVDQIMDVLGNGAVRYDGKVDEDQAERNKLEFQRGDAQWFVGTAAKGGPGLTLHQAKSVIYYSNSYKLIDRLQSEDRAHRAGMDDRPVHYIDLVCPGTVDEKIIENLRNKVDIQSQITGDTLKEWI